MLKTGAQHARSLNDGRAVFIEGRRVADVTTHAAFARSVASVCRLYDFQCAPENLELMTFQPDGADSRAHRMWQLPRSYEELKVRRAALTAWSALHAGFIGRSPDHVASCISGMYMGRDVFAEYDQRSAGALEDYYRYARDRDLYLTYVIINPQADRSKAAGQQADPFLTAGIVDRDARGVTIRGAKMLGTAAVMANEVFVTCIQPLQPGDERYAVSFAIPLNSPGLRILSRRSYEQAARSTFDHPFSSRYDENDALLYFDDVHVPWERVFIAGDVAMCQKQFFATPAHVYQNYQAQIRLMVKLKFLAGIAHRIASINGVMAFAQVRETLGQLAANAAMVEAMVYGMEARGQMAGDYFVPDRQTLYAAQVLTQQLYPRFVEALRDLAGGGMIMLPSSIADFADPELRRLIEKTQQSPATDAHQRVKFYKLAWDLVGSEFGSRHTQYEMFYAGATFVTKGHSFRCYDWAASASMVDRVLEEYSLEGSLDEAARTQEIAHAI
jgi:4-hydroxyphenylacetate 3-monooxygenase